MIKGIESTADILNIAEQPEEDVYEVRELGKKRPSVQVGGTVIAQDEASSVVWGMPGAVAQAGLCHAVLPLPRIAPKLLDMLRMARA